jgi:glucokinase
LLEPDAGRRVAVDIGATKTVVAYLQGEEIHTVDRFPTPTRADHAVEAIATAIGRSAVAKRLRAVGIGAPGPLNPATGQILSPPNLPGWRNFALTARLENQLGVPVRLENDANLGALGEAVYGSGKDYASMFYLTLSTGIGAGLIINGRIFGGHRGIAGEVYAIEPGYFYGRNTGVNIIELASGPGLVRRAIRAIEEGASTSLSREGLDPKALIAAEEQGDPLAKEVLDGGRNAIAGLLIMVLTTFAPEAVVLAGGLCNESHFYVEPVRARISKWLKIPELAEIPIYRAKLWDTAVLYGAAELVRNPSCVS